MVSGGRRGRLAGAGGGLGVVGDLEFGEDRGDVIADGLEAGDKVVAIAGGELEEGSAVGTAGVLPAKKPMIGLVAVGPRWRGLRRPCGRRTDGGVR